VSRGGAASTLRVGGLVGVCILVRGGIRLVTVVILVRRERILLITVIDIAQGVRLVFTKEHRFVTMVVIRATMHTFIRESEEGGN